MSSSLRIPPPPKVKGTLSKHAKRGMFGLMHWQERHFVLCGDLLEWFVSADAPTPQRALSISRQTVCSVPAGASDGEVGDEGPFAFVVEHAPAHKAWTLRAKTARARRLWLRALSLAGADVPPDFAASDAEKLEYRQLTSEFLLSLNAPADASSSSSAPSQPALPSAAAAAASREVELQVEREDGVKLESGARQTRMQRSLTSLLINSPAGQTLQQAGRESKTAAVLPFACQACTPPARYPTQMQLDAHIRTHHMAAGDATLASPRAAPTVAFDVPKSPPRDMPVSSPRDVPVSPPRDVPASPRAPVATPAQQPQPEPQQPQQPPAQPQTPQRAPVQPQQPPTQPQAPQRTPSRAAPHANLTLPLPAATAPPPPRPQSPPAPLITPAPPLSERDDEAPPAIPDEPVPVGSREPSPAPIDKPPASPSGAGSARYDARGSGSVLKVPQRFSQPSRPPPARSALPATPARRIAPAPVSRRMPVTPAAAAPPLDEVPLPAPSDEPPPSPPADEHEHVRALVLSNVNYGLPEPDE